MPPLLVGGTVWTRRRPSPASKARLLPMKASCQRRGSRPSPGEWKERVGLSTKAGEAAQRAWPWLSTLRSCTGCLQEPSLSASLHVKPSCSCFPHLTSGEDTSKPGSARKPKGDSQLL